MIATYDNDEGAASIVPGRFSWRGLAVFVPGAAALAVPVALIAEVLQTDLRFFPLVIFPLIMGVMLGTLLLCLMRLAQVGHRPTLLAGALLAAAVAVVGQHYLLYRAALDRAEQLEQVRRAFPEAAERIPARPEDFGDFLREDAARGRPLWRGVTARGAWAWATWGLDAVLLAAATVAMLVPAMRLPYCNGCRTWFRAMRAGRVGGATISLMAATAHVTIDRAPRSGRYRLLSCHGGCGPTALELLWEDDQGETYSADAWLDAGQRNRIMQLADEAGGPREAGDTAA